MVGAYSSRPERVLMATAVLGVPKDASKAEVKKAYHKVHFIHMFLLPSLTSAR